MWAQCIEWQPKFWSINGKVKDLLNIHPEVYVNQLLDDLADRGRVVHLHLEKNIQPVDNFLSQEGGHLVFLQVILLHQRYWQKLYNYLLHFYYYAYWNDVLER